VRSPRQPLRVALRFVASVMLTSGTLLIADAAITLAWQEPISALLAAAEQRRLERELSAAERRFRPRADSTLGTPAAQASRLARETGAGDALGRIELPTLGRSSVIAEGTDTATLRTGPGHYPDTPLPGQGGTVGVAGHRTTYGAPFRPIDRLRPGQRVVAQMPYGRFVYAVEKTRIVKPDEVWVKRRVRHERLILSACNPLYSARERIVVFARLIRVERP
jgi:sortase A